MHELTRRLAREDLLAHFITRLKAKAHYDILQVFIYQPAPALPQAEVALPHAVEQLPAQSAQTILVIDSPHLGLLGLLIDGTPTLKRVPPSAFTPVPASYPTLHRLQGIHTLVAAEANEPPLFLLDLEALLP